MKLSKLLGKKTLLLVGVLVLSFTLLMSCGAGGEPTTATTNGAEATTKSGQKEEEDITPTPAPEPSPPVAQEVTCGIGAFNVLNCSNQAGEQFSCSDNSHAVGTPYGCTDPENNQFDCNIVATRMGGFTLSCARLIQ